MKIFNRYIIVLMVAVTLAGCSRPEGDYPGTEYMPDMGHSIAYEANLYDYYYYNTWDGEDEYYKRAQPRKPVAGTIPRGDAGIGPDDEKRKAAMQGYELNGFAPYPYEDTEEERARATREIIQNPYPITQDGLERGKHLYDIYCGICHGPKGTGEGYLVSEDNPNAVYPAQPAILTSDTFTNTNNGQLYHAIMYGKNVMGGYADKLSYEERWQVVHYIRNLQAKNKKLVYTPEENTLNDGAIPIAQWVKLHPGAADMEAHHASDMDEHVKDIHEDAIEELHDEIEGEH